MISARKYMVVQRVTVLGGLFLALYLFMVFLPLCDRVAALDKPLEQAWGAIANTRVVEAGPQGVNFAPLEQRLQDLEYLSHRLEAVSNAITQRLNLDAPVREKLRQPFQLVDFQNERQLNQEELVRLAAEKQVTLAPGVLAGYPEYSADMKNPELLWGHLSVTHEALRLAARSQLTNLLALSVRPPRMLQTNEGGRALAYELPVTLQAAGSMEAVARFLTCLPVRAEEVRAPGLPEMPASKPALFIERVLIRKEAPPYANRVRLEVRLSGIALKEQ